MIDLNKHMVGLACQQNEIQEAIAVYARSLIPTLKDRGCTNAAAHLEELCFQFDAVRREGMDALRQWYELREKGR